MVRHVFASSDQALRSQLDFIGRGIEMKSYDMARQYTSSKPLAIRISPFTPHLSSDPERDLFELSFGAILSGKSSVAAGSQTCSSTDGSRIVLSPLQTRLSTPVDSINAPPYLLEEAVPPDIIKANGDSDTEHPILDPAVVQTYHQAILDLRSCIEQQRNHIIEEEQDVQNLEKELFYMELMVSSAEPPAHLKIKNIFDDPTPLEWPLGNDPDSPTGKTLVELEVAGASHSSQTRTMSSVSQEHLDPKCEESDDVSMTDLMLDIDPQEKDISSPTLTLSQVVQRMPVPKAIQRATTFQLTQKMRPSRQSESKGLRTSVLIMPPTTHRALTTMIDLQAHLDPFRGHADAYSAAPRASPTRSLQTSSIT
ncbi:MAG: hypothetical protein Q9194_001465 [Teloschistes cf. exilis]